MKRPLVSDETLDTLLEDAWETVKTGDYSACPVTGQQGVMKAVLATQSALLHNVRHGNGNGNGDNQLRFRQMPRTAKEWAYCVLQKSAVAFVILILGLAALFRQPIVKLWERHQKPMATQTPSALTEHIEEHKP